MMNAPKVGIVVLNYNGTTCLSTCLQSLQSLDYSNKEIIVVDNGSTDASYFQAKQLFPLCTFVANEHNEGFAKGMNKGMRLALHHGAQWCLLFNYDAEIEPSTITELLSVVAKHPHAGLLSPLILEKQSNYIWFAKGNIDYFRMRTTHLGVSAQELTQEVIPSNFLTGCSLLIKKELIDAIGFLDERFFLYYEDADYSLRARKAGFECLVVPKARVWHSEVSNHNPQKTYFLVLSGLLFFQKYASALYRVYFSLYVTIRRTKNLIDRLLKRKNAQAVYLAYEHFFHGH